MAEFGTKAETLEQLQGKLKTAEVLPLYRFSVKDWTTSPDQCLENFKALDWADTTLIVRSSAQSEDSEQESLAGHFTSSLNVKGDESLLTAIKDVIASFGDADDEDQVFIQPMLLDVQASGVAFTRDPNTSGPYFVLNYADGGAATDTVTGGAEEETKVYIRHHSSEETPPESLVGVLAMCEELVAYYGKDCLDIEFSTASDGKVYLLQVRPLILPTKRRVVDDLHKNNISNIASMVGRSNARHPYLVGRRTVYGVMPDWNPAEIIGIRPQPLALSLYRDLITDATWAYQRDNYGYRNLRSMPLMVDFHGLPYIDVRVSFNSFIPKDVDNELAERLVNHYVDSLIENPTLHDKVEFDVVFSCYTLDLSKRLTRLKEYGFSQSECNDLSDSLRKLTNNIINNNSGLWRKDLRKIEKLEMRRKKILSSGFDHATMIYWLIEDCRRYGTLPFAGLARAGFIAVQLLHSLVQVGIITPEEEARFMASLSTVGSRLVRDFSHLSKEMFLQIYGHLRPGTYDIRSPRYDEMPDHYFNWENSSPPAETVAGMEGDLNMGETHGDFSLSLKQLKQIEELLSSHGLDHDVLGFFEFIKAGIEGREYAKFVFTNSLSDALSMFRELGAEYGFSVEDCAYSNINCIKDLMITSHDPKTLLAESIEAGKRQYSETQSISLPPLIVEPKDVWEFYQPRNEPNYISQNRTSAPVISGNLEGQDLTDAIVMIPSADPGYDWIFSHKIAGLVTKYGGVNSHMAIRAGELGIPAVIGVGEIRYQKWEAANQLSIDCAGRRVEILH